MKVSLNAIKLINQHYGSAGDPAPDGIDALVEKIGSQLGEVESVTDLGKKYQGIIVAQVVSCLKHPNADKLSICKIDDGHKVPKVERDKDGYIQVVCGAPNVRKGLLVAWLPPGVSVPSTFDKDPLILETREIRGQISNGMLASPQELAIGDGYEGLLEIDKDAKPGSDFAEVYKLDDYIIDIENKMFTHRPDCFGFLGVAREICGIQGRAFKSPAWYVQDPEFPKVEAEELKLEVKNELPKLVPRFVVITMRDVRVEPSPVWLRAMLSKVGVKPINNIVDYTNFFMLETGQPLHAYDYDKVKAIDGGGQATLTIRFPKKAEKLKLLNGREMEPRQEAIMIATDKTAIGIGGVMGGVDTEVDNQTKNIILECATFDMYSIRRTSMTHGLFTDAVTRFTKGQSSMQNLAVLAKVVDEIRQFAGGKVASKVIDSNHSKVTQSAVHVTAQFVNQRLGLGLKPGQIKTILENVEFKVHEDKAILAVTPPFWRTDIEIAEDIVEEVGRLYGFDKLPLELPSRSIAPAPKDPLLELKARLRSLLSAAGANEVLTYGFVHANLLDKVGQDKSQAFQLSNALSPDLQYYRLSLVPSLLDKVHANIKAGFNGFALFEINQTHSKDLIDQTTKLPIEEYRLSLVFAADDKASKANYAGAPYYQAKQYLTVILASLGIKPAFELASSHSPKMAVGRAALAPFEPSRAAYVMAESGKLLGELGEFTASTRRNLKLPKFAAGFELDVMRLLEESRKLSGYEVLSRFPSVEQDITLKVQLALPYQGLINFAHSELNRTQPKDSISSLKLVDIYGRANDKAHKQITLRLNIASREKTMTDTEVNALLDKVAAAAKAKFGAERI